MYFVMFLSRLKDRLSKIKGILNRNTNFTVLTSETSEMNMFRTCSQCSDNFIIFNKSLSMSVELRCINKSVK